MNTKFCAYTQMLYEASFRYLFVAYVFLKLSSCIDFLLQGRDVYILVSKFLNLKLRCTE